MNRIKIDDIVFVPKWGYTFDDHEQMARILNVKNWDRGRTCPTGIDKKYKVIEIDKSCKGFYTIAYIESIDTKKGYLMDINGLRKIDNFLTEEDFSL